MQFASSATCQKRKSFEEETNSSKRSNVYGSENQPSSSKSFMFNPVTDGEPSKADVKNRPLDYFAFRNVMLAEIGGCYAGFPSPNYLFVGNSFFVLKSSMHPDDLVTAIKHEFWITVHGGQLLPDQELINNDTIVIKSQYDDLNKTFGWVKPNANLYEASLLYTIVENPPLDQTAKGVLKEFGYLQEKHFPVPSASGHTNTEHATTNEQATNEQAHAENQMEKTVKTKDHETSKQTTSAKGEMTSSVAGCSMERAESEAAPDQTKENNKTREYERYEQLVMELEKERGNLIVKAAALVMPGLQMIDEAILEAHFKKHLFEWVNEHKGQEKNHAREKLHRTCDEALAKVRLLLSEAHKDLTLASYSSGGANTSFNFYKTYRNFPF